MKTLATAALLAAAGACGRTPETPAPSTVAAPAQLTWRGMTFAHEGYDGLTGYGGPSVGPSLDSLLRLGVNALAVVPYTFMPDAHVPSALPVATRRGSETDGAVAHALAEARARGLRVMLKPQIWVRGAWPGEIDFATDADWAAFHDHYRAWILHYARLAAEHDVAALCLGTELTRATLAHPAFWRKLIADARDVYGGTLTYAANWGEEFEQLAFWDALDAVGLNAYYPLSGKPDPTDAELLAGARAWMTMANAVAERAGKPLWLTEVGYRSARQAWRQPHAATGARPPSESCQARSYRAMLTAAAEAERLEGIFVWKWPSYLGYEGGGEWDEPGDGTGFTPGGKAAAEVLTAFYGGD